MLVSGTMAPQLFQRNGPLESQCTRACSKSGSFCADCRLCLAACCQALKNTAQNSIAMPARYPRHASKWHCGTPTVSTKRPAGITVHASMLKKRFLLRRLLSVPGCVLSSAENTAQNSIAMPARYPRLTMQVSGTVAPQLFQRNGPLESQCTPACSKSVSFCADCCLCLAACCQALKTLHRTA